MLMAHFCLSITLLFLSLYVGVKLKVLLCISYCLASVSPVDFCLPWNNMCQNMCHNIITGYPVSAYHGVITSLTMVLCAPILL